MSRPPQLTRNDRAERHKRIAAAIRGGMPSRAVARLFGLTDSHVRYIGRIYEVSCGVPPGRRPRSEAAS